MKYAIRKNNYLGFDYYLCRWNLGDDFPVWLPVKYDGERVLFSKKTAKKKAAKLNKENYFIGVTYTVEEA